MSYRIKQIAKDEFVIQKKEMSYSKTRGLRNIFKTQYTIKSQWVDLKNDYLFSHYKTLKEARIAFQEYMKGDACIKIHKLDIITDYKSFYQNKGLDEIRGGIE